MNTLSGSRLYSEVCGNTTKEKGRMNTGLRLYSEMCEDNEESSLSNEKQIRHEEYYVDNFVPELVCT